MKRLSLSKLLRLPFRKLLEFGASDPRVTTNFPSPSVSLFILLYKGTNVPKSTFSPTRGKKNVNTKAGLQFPSGASKFQPDKRRNVMPPSEGEAVPMY
ncbi:hypothetical protein EVAR_3393_1 [Eumeta japonica]|uniref:Uncharacterized protein n=1 Tax=Eumeta variegata TaxID=151549 RepID=A0A4C1SV07_EUMVA|nr:hypothetical protein EVAR_3393_1 [Eumeta japonica]